MTSTGSYFMDIFGREFASVSAVSQFIRLMWSAVVPIIVVPAEQSIGNGSLFTILAISCVVSALMVLWTVFWGIEDRLRRMPFVYASLDVPPALFVLMRLLLYRWRRHHLNQLPS